MFLQKELIKRFLPHISTLTILFGVTGVYILGNPEWVRQYLPENGEPLTLFLLFGLVLIYELSLRGQKIIEGKVTKMSDKIDVVSTQIQTTSLMQAVNGMYGRFIVSGDKFIDNEYTIKELYELYDMREKLNVNSYTQGRLEFLKSKIKRD